MTKLDFLKTLPNREKIYIIFSRLTNLPYVECNARTFDDEAFLFTGEEDALKKAKELSDGPQPAVAVCSVFSCLSWCAAPESKSFRPKSGPWKIRRSSSV